jgi:hypothetical protein
VAVGVDYVGDRQALRASALHHRLGRVRRIDQHTGLRVAVAQEVAVVAIAPDLFEDELHEMG